MMFDSDQNQNYWYYTLRGQEHGPVLLSRLRQMARSGILATGDLVRKGKTGEWAPAETVDEISLQPRNSEDDQVPGPSEPLSVVVEPNRNWLFVDSLRETIADFVSQSISAISERSKAIRTAVGYVALVAVLAGLVLTTFNGMQFGSKSSAEPFVVYESIWGKLQTLRKNQADDATWNGFVQQSRDELKPIIARLEREAGASNRSAQLLLWAGRDCLLTMLADARKAPSSSEHMLLEHLRNVRRIQAGESVYGSRVAGRQPWDPYVDYVRSWFTRDPVSAVMTVLLCTANLIAVCWFTRRLFQRGILRRSN